MTWEEAISQDGTIKRFFIRDAPFENMGAFGYIRKYKIINGAVYHFVGESSVSPTPDDLEATDWERVNDLAATRSQGEKE